MKYDIYFHGGCFDGSASAAMLLWFLRQRGDDYGKFIPLTHPVNKKWWKSLKMKRPSAVVDILYHPKAAIWFDHHPTTFIDKKWEKSFKRDLRHQLDVKSPSCAGLIYRHFTKSLKVKQPKHIKELVCWADMIDRARFKSPSDAISFKKPALQIAKSLYETNPSKAYQILLIRTLSEKYLSKVAMMSEVRSRFLKYKNLFDRDIGLLKDKVLVFGNTSFFDSTERDFAGSKFAMYYFYPKANYSLRLLKRDGRLILSAGVNPWYLPKKGVDLGKFLARNYGGGGHPYAASGYFKNQNEAMREIPKIVKYLNQHA